MGESLTERRRVGEEGLTIVKPCQRGRNPGVLYHHGLTLPSKEAPANSVPAAAVTRGERTLFGITGRKGRAGGSVSEA